MVTQVTVNFWDRCICWPTYQNLALWFDSWEAFLVDIGVATTNQTGELNIKDKMKGRILNMDETCLSFNGSNSNQGYFDVRFPLLGKAMLKSVLMTMMISGSTAVGEPLPPPISVSDVCADSQG